MRLVGIALGIALALSSAASLARPAQDDATATPSAELVALLQASDAAAREGDLGAAESHLLKAAAHPDFLSAPVRVRRVTFSFAARYAQERGDRPAAYAHVRRATAYEPSRFEDWALRADLALALGYEDDVADSARELFTRWPEQSRDSDLFLVQAVWRTAFDSPARYALEQALFDGGFEMRWTGAPDELWHDLALQHLARGKPEEARATLARIGDPYTLASVLADRRFDGVRDPSLTPEALLTQGHLHVADLRTRALLDPQVLAIQAQLASAMLVIGAHEDVVALAEEVSQALADGSDDYIDADEQLSWLYDRAGEALERLGRREEALAMYRRAAELPELGRPNISQLLNLGHHLVTAGKPREALEAVAKVGSMSPYGRMVLVNVQLRAAHALGDQDGVDAALAYLRENREHGEGVYADALYDLGDHDAAARQLIERLDNPATRAEALMEVQIHPDLPSLNPGPGDGAWEAMMAREDVAAAIERAGRRLELPIHLPW